jgi:hypothetical protein
MPWLQVDTGCCNGWVTAISTASAPRRWRSSLPGRRARARTSDPTDGTGRIAQRVATDRVISVHDPDTRHVHQPTDGDKAHVAGEVDMGLITDCARRQGSAAPKLRGHLEDWSGGPARIPGLQVLGDQPTVPLRPAPRCLRPGHLGVIKPIPQRTPVEDRFTRDDFIRRRDRRPGHLPRRPRRGDEPSTPCRHRIPLPRPLITGARCTTAQRGAMSHCTTTTRGCSPYANKPKRRIPNHLPTEPADVERWIA